MTAAEHTVPSRKWLASFQLRTNLRVVPKEASLKRAFGAGEVYFSNVEYDGGGVYFLDLKLIFRAPTIEEAHDVAQDMAEECAFALSFVSGAGVRVDCPIYLIDWDSGVKMRDQYTYAKHALNDPLDSLDDVMLRTVAAVSASEVSSAAKAAMRWYGRGARATVLEDQFQYYFFAIEVLASAEQFDDKVADKCQKCHGDLYCPEHGKSEHRPFPRQKIAMLLKAVGMSDRLIAAVTELRNLIAHGEEREDIAEKMTKLTSDYELGQAVAVMKKFATEALHRAFDFPDQEPPLTFYYLENPENLNINGRFHLQTELKGDPDNPKFEEVWMPQVDVILTDPKTGVQEIVPAGGKRQAAFSKDGERQNPASGSGGSRASGAG